MVLFGDILLALVLLYLLIGVALSIRFVTVIAPGFNDRAQVGTLLFRAILIPGCSLLWPLILRAGSHGVGRFRKPEVEP